MLKCRVEGDMPVLKPKKPQQESEIKAVLERPLYHDRNELKTTYINSFETEENSKRADKMWETGNFNKEPASCDNSGKEHQISRDCGNEEQDSGYTAYFSLVSVHQNVT